MSRLFETNDEGDWPHWWQPMMAILGMFLGVFGVVIPWIVGLATIFDHLRWVP